MSNSYMIQHAVSISDSWLQCFKKGTHCSADLGAEQGEASAERKSVLRLSCKYTVVKLDGSTPKRWISKGP